MSQAAFLVAVVGVSLLAACSSGGGPASKGVESSGEAPKVGFMAPDFDLPDPNGGRVRLSDFRGHPVFLNFWATWCVPCRSEMPQMQQVFEEKQNDGLAVVAINLGESAQPLLAFANELGITFTLALDKDQTVTEKYRVLGLPSSFFVDRDGIIRAVKLGPFLSKEEIENRVQVIMANQ